jgi:Mce-associated membrane protein
MSAGRLLAWWALIVTLVAATAAAAYIGSTQMVAKDRAPLVVDGPTQRAAAVTVVQEAFPKLWSYTPQSVDSDFTSAASVLTGELRERYLKQVRDVRSSQSQLNVTSTFKVLAAGVESLTADKADVIAVGNRTYTATNSTINKAQLLSFKLHLTKIEGAWLIERMDILSSTDATQAPG